MLVAEIGGGGDSSKDHPLTGDLQSSFWERSLYPLCFYLNDYHLVLPKAMMISMHALILT